MAFFQNAITQLSVLGVPMYAGISTASILPSPLSLVISVNVPTIVGKANIPVDPSVLVLSINNPTIVVNTGTVVSVNALSIKISTNTPTVVGKANVSVNPNTIVISTNTPTVVGKANVLVNALSIKISTNTPTVVGKSNVSVNPLSIVISTNAATVIGKANVSTNELTVIINTSDPLIRLGQNVFPDPSVLKISTNTPTIVGNANVSVNESTIVISINNPTIIGKANIPVDPSTVIISIVDPTITFGIHVIVDNLNIIINTNTPNVHVSQTIIPTSLILYVSLIAPTFTTEISEYDQYPACPRDIFGDWFQEDRQVYDREKEMLAMLHMEAFNMFGVPMLYYAASYNTSANKIFGEDNNRRFTQVFDIMSFYHLPREDKLWSKFGIEGIDEITMYISKEHFQYVTSSTGGYSYIPKTGDIIKAKYNNYYYEIVAIKEEASQFLQSKRYVWELIVRPFKDQHIINMITGDPIGSVTNKTTDLFDRVQAINNKMSGIAYQPKACELPANDPFALWR